MQLVVVESLVRDKASNVQKSPTNQRCFASLYTKGPVTIMRLLLISPLFFASIAFAEDAKDELVKLTGTWEITSVVAAGNEMPKRKGFVMLVVKDGRLSMVDDGKPIETFSNLRMTLDPKKSPKVLDLIRGDNEELPAIYELKDDELKIAISMVPLKRKPDEKLPRPESFDSKGKEFLVITAKRRK